jgi:3-oxoacyl-[acyl-carrier protein] reductase
MSRVIVVTGAGGALGTAICRKLAGEPDTTLVVSDIAEVDVEGAEFVRADVSDEAQVAAVVQRAVDLHGRLDVYIGNAGVLSPNGRIHNLTPEDWERAFRINVLGSANGVKAAVGVMRPQRSGSIILTASVSGLTAWSHAAPYCATKAAVIQLANA